jgi:hypothetical protein
MPGVVYTAAFHLRQDTGLADYKPIRKYRSPELLEASGGTFTVILHLYRHRYLYLFCPAPVVLLAFFDTCAPGKCGDYR